MKPDPGPCDAIFPMWFFDFTDGTCKQFNYGGCEGNENRFRSKEECERTCGKTLHEVKVK